MATSHHTTNALLSSEHPSDNLLAASNSLAFIEGFLEEKMKPDRHLEIEYNQASGLLWTLRNTIAALDAVGNHIDAQSPGRVTSLREGGAS